MSSHIIAQSFSGAGTVFTASNTYTGDAETILTASIPSKNEYNQVNIVIDLDDVISYFILCDQDVSLKTNDYSDADNTVNLVANVPLIWNSDSYYTGLLTVTVSSMWVLNNSGTTATFKVGYLYDSTP